jgi:CRP-like cAMP-binding protein
MGVPVDVLRRIPLLSTVDDAELAQLAGRFCEKTFDRGAPVVSRGSSGSGFFIIAEGEATVHGGGAKTARLGKHDFFGEISLIDGGKRSRDITAETSMRCWGISRKEFRAFVKGHPDVAWSMLECLATRLRNADVPVPPKPEPRQRRWALRRARARH